MRRNDCALEVRLIGQKGPAGWLTNICVGGGFPRNNKHVVITIARIQDGQVIDDQRSFKLEDQHQVIDRVALVNARNPQALLAKLGIPHYAEPFKEGNRDATRYTWKVLRLTEEQYEWLFDFEDFEPADTEEDRELVIQERRENFLDNIGRSFAQKMDQQFFETLIGGSTYTNTSASASDSTMTLEKLQEAIRAVSIITGKL